MGPIGSRLRTSGRTAFTPGPARTTLRTACNGMQSLAALGCKAATLGCNAAALGCKAATLGCKAANVFGQTDS